MFLSPLGERLGEGVQHEDYLLYHPLTQPLPQGGEEEEWKECRFVEGSNVDEVTDKAVIT